MSEETAKAKATLTMAQAIGFAITILITVFSAWVSTQNRITVLEIQMQNGDNDRSRIENKIDKLSLKIDAVTESIYELKLNNKK